MTFLIYFVFSVAVIFMPWLFLWDSKKLTGADLRIKYPEFAWIEKRHSFYGGIMGIMAFALAALISIQLAKMGKQSDYVFVCGFGACMAAFNGLFAVITAVCPIPRYKTDYLFVYDSKSQLAGLAQLLLATAVMVALYFSSLWTP